MTTETMNLAIARGGVVTSSPAPGVAPPTRTLLLCPPDFYGIEYEINPWMHRTHGADQALAVKQWRGLRDTLNSLGCQTELMPPQPGLPDLVFTANAGLAIGRQFIPANFRFKERQGEEPFFIDWFANQGFQITRLPRDLAFEGEGDALFCGDVLFCGYRYRSDIRSHHRLGEALNCLVISVELVDERFYHLDTCFCPLPDGGAIWFPGAFDEYGQSAIRQHCGPLIKVLPEEARHFCCNAVVIGSEIVLPEGCSQLYGELEKRGYRPHPLPMSEFIKAGGACKCLTLYLPARETFARRDLHRA
jgi:N-dimethylarginine dimethylaminohydrolase